MKKLVFLLALMQLAFLVEIDGQLTNGLVSYWKFDESYANQGNVLDAAGNNNGTTCCGMMGLENTGIIDKAYYYDGYVNIPYDTSLDITGNTITLSAWIKPGATGKTQMIMSKIHETGTHISPYFQYNLQLYYGSAKMYPRFLLSVGGVVKMAASSTYNLSVNQWYHIVGTYDGSTMRLYLDGIQIASTSVTGNITGYNTPVYFGVNGALGEEYLGLIDESGIWNRALTAAEVTSLYNNGSGLTYPFGENVAVTGVSLNIGSANTTIGGSVQLAATVQPSNATNKSVTWASDNASIASVSSTGLVIGVNSGTATITVATTDGNKTATSTVTVSGSAPSTAWVSNGNNIYYNNNGNVGIGSSDSQVEKLDVSGNLFLRNLSNTSYAGAYIHFSSYAGNYPGPKIRSSLIHASGSDTRSMLILSSYFNGYKDELTLTNGMVGIGTNSPTCKLTVNGKILATEVEVVSNIASDYVFEPAYQLMPLTDLEIYLKQHKHLPGIPSALEFKDKGQNLGEMQDMLLRKIEELTLYIIEQEKEIKLLRKEIEEQKAFKEQ